MLHLKNAKGTFGSSLTHVLIITSHWPTLFQLSSLPCRNFLKIRNRIVYSFIKGLPPIIVSFLKCDNGDRSVGD